MFSQEIKEAMLLVAGAAHFIQVPLSLVLAREILPFRVELPKMLPLMRLSFLVVIIAVTLTMQATGVLVVVYREELAEGAGLAFGFTFYLTVFFAVRLVAQGVYRSSGAWPARGDALLWHRVLLTIFATQTALYATVAVT